ncbi:MAG: hypothetical protein KGJ06_09990 [Pseudomonadota bacterium]|nr:hypothetical protein [Pseudomonadota bacterium]
MNQDDTNTQETPAPELKKTPPQEISITGRLDQYRSSYWATAVAVLPIRYIFKQLLPDRWSKWKNGNKTTEFLARHMYSLLAGAFMEGITFYHARRTKKDIRSIFAQALAWEFDKDPKDVTWSDFQKSTNSIVRQTLENYYGLNARRAAVNATFFAPLLLKPIFKTEKWHPELGADIGLTANAAYLFRDVMVRKSTPFEELQSTIDLKINHASSPADKIEAADLLNIYERHAAKGVIDSFVGQRGTPQWDRSMEIFTRMADLMNQTYSKVTPHEHADFGIPKFIYLVGHNLIEPGDIERTRAYIEVANRHGIRALKKVVADMQQGMDLEHAIQQYPVDLPKPAEEKTQASHASRVVRSQHPAPPESFTDRTKDKGGSLSPAVV